MKIDPQRTVNALHQLYTLEEGEKDTLPKAFTALTKSVMQKDVQDFFVLAGRLERPEFWHYVCRADLQHLRAYGLKYFVWFVISEMREQQRTRAYQLYTADMLYLVLYLLVSRWRKPSARSWQSTTSRYLSAGTRLRWKKRRRAGKRPLQTAEKPQAERRW